MKAIVAIAAMVIGCQMWAQNVMTGYSPIAPCENSEAGTSAWAYCSHSANCWDGEFEGGLFWGIGVSRYAYVYCPQSGFAEAESFAAGSNSLFAMSTVIYTPLLIALSGENEEDCDGGFISDPPISFSC